ncbi:MAG: hypothetical protein LIP77_08865, partial [Planctomycetes bacterium]|nr:hypothetical protein [Planctomycetota bacterium]
PRLKTGQVETGSGAAVGGGGVTAAAGARHQDNRSQGQTIPFHRAPFGFHRQPQPESLKTGQEIRSLLT